MLAVLPGVKMQRVARCGTEQPAPRCLITKRLSQYTIAHLCEIMHPLLYWNYRYEDLCINYYIAVISTYHPTRYRTASVRYDLAELQRRAGLMRFVLCNVTLREAKLLFYMRRIIGRNYVIIVWNARDVSTSKRR